MTATKLMESEMNAARIASLPTRPTAPVAFGGRGYTSTQMKEAFDKLPNLIAQRYNALIDDIESGAVCASIPTGIEAVPTLNELISAIGDERFAAALTVLGSSLTAYLQKLRSDIDTLGSAVGVNLEVG